MNPDKELEFNEKITEGQMSEIFFLLVFAFLVWIVELVNPTFFNFPYLQAPTMESVLRFWPLSLYGIFWALVAASHARSSDLDEEIFWSDFWVSIRAGVLEELGFRCLYICTAMIALAAVNMFFSAIGALAVAVIIAIPAILICVAARNSPLLKGVGTVIMIALIVYGLMMSWSTFKGTNPWYWVYENIIVPTINVVTLGYFSPIFKGDHPRTFVFAMIAMNAKFREGHEYQGDFGRYNAWVIGFVMMYATMTYGLWVAMIIHVIYDLQFAFTKYIARKMRCFKTLPS